MFLEWWLCCSLNGDFLSKKFSILDATLREKIREFTVVSNMTGSLEVLLSGDASTQIYFEWKQPRKHIPAVKKCWTHHWDIGTSQLASNASRKKSRWVKTVFRVCLRFATHNKWIYFRRLSGPGSSEDIDKWQTRQEPEVRRRLIKFK